VNWISGYIESEQQTARLQQRIVAFALLGVLITGVAVGLATAIPAYNAAKEAVERLSDYQVRLEAMALNQYLTRLGDMAMQVTSRSVIRDKLELYNQHRLPLSELQSFTAAKLEDALRQHPDAEGITRLDAAGAVVVQVGTPVPTLAPIPPLNTRHPELAAPMAAGGRYLLVVGAPIVNAKGERVGTDLVVFRSEGLATLLQGLQEAGSSKAYFAARDARLWSPAGDRQLAAVPSTPLLDGAVAGAFDKRHGLLRGADDLVVLFAPVTDRWAVAVTVPAGALYAPALHQIALPVLAVLVMLLLASVVTTRLLRPLAQRSVRLASRLRVAAEEQRSLLEYAHSFLYRTDGGRISFISPSVDDVLGFGAEELPPSLVAELISVADADVAPGEEVPPRLLRVSNRDGDDVVLEVNARAYRSENDRVGIFAVARDITEREQAVEAQRASEERLRTLINAGPDFICFKDGAGRWQEANQAGLALFGLDAGGYRDATDEELAAALPPVHAAMVRKLAEAESWTWEARTTVRSEETLPGPDGERVLDLIRVPLFDGAGGRSGMVILGRDVTARRRAERELARTSAEWTYSMDFLEDAVCLVDLELRIIRANRGFYRLAGRAPEQLMGESIAAVLRLKRPEECRVCQALVDRRDAFITLEAGDHDNFTGRPTEVMVKVVPDGDGGPARLLLGFHDLTRTRSTEEELRLAASVFQGSYEGVVITDAERRVLRVNDSFIRTMGYTAAEVSGLSMQEVLWSRKDEENRYGPVWDAVDMNGMWHGEAWYRRKNGEMFPVWHRISVLRDQNGKPLHYINTFTDISDKKLSEERIHHLAHYDVITDLPNRLLFNDRFNHSVERALRSGDKLALLFIDLDRFKNVNDTLGHHVGDELLRVVGDRLRKSVREIDTVARLGGDEFTVVLEEMTRVQDAGVVASKILAAIGQPLIVGDHELFLGASIGISIFPDDGEEVQTLLRNADAAMYRAKEQGRNTYQFYTPELTTASIERLDLENSLRRALERGELALYYQPQVSLPTGRVIGAEALLRWNHPLKGMISPNVFVPLAEDSGLILQIGAWVLDTACEQLRAWQKAGLAIERMAVNLSGQQIMRGDLLDAVRLALARSAINAADLELEVTESFVMSHLSDGVDVLNGLKELGVTIAIDDFGTGYSSLAYLKRLPIDRLKIDRSFVQDIPGDRDDMAIAATIIAMAHTLDLDVIAEGVEQESQAAFLRRHHCDEVQGFLYGRPMPAEEFEVLLEKAAAK
jgi:diguanylate cyclase (GGDEF)-like protein/PAS domain S-box-containing protein